ncbi:hypothetical protein GIB67_002536 [Kingdonia uniflora]|uniref:MTTase N-terminal domain-containing protein n=1 Tax=Kingdonia uniflora TaxID=39325 RepID=A0A7J7N8H4_9MAGN|nr:hypothetical protein GIB67_002536 [Kingdonia uniflora]
MDTLIGKCKSAKKPLVVAGCVPQGSRDLKELEGVSVVGVQQIDSVVKVIKETLKDHEVCLLNRKTLPTLDLPKVRKNNFIKILLINVGCLVQSGSNTILTIMNREYTVGEFKTVVDTLYELVHEMWIATDIIYGLPSKTEEDFAQTLDLIRNYKFPQAFHKLAYIILLPPFGGYDAWKRTSVVATSFDFDQTQSVRPKGYYVVVRVTSEDPDDGFKPASGKVQDKGGRWIIVRHITTRIMTLICTFKVNRYEVCQNLA